MSIQLHECETCGKAFLTKKSRDAHKSLGHKERPETPSDAQVREQLGLSVGVVRPNSNSQRVTLHIPDGGMPLCVQSRTAKDCDWSEKLLEHVPVGYWDWCRDCLRAEGML